MKQQHLRSIGLYVRPALLFVFACLAMVPGRSMAALSLGFSSPANNGTYGADFVGTFTYSPNGPVTATVTNGTSIVPPANVDVSIGGGNGTVTLTPVFGQTGRVDVLLDRNSGADQVSFTVNFQGPSAAMSLTPNFNSPATNSSAGAAFSSSFSFTPTNSDAKFNIVITSGSSIVPGANVSLTTNILNGTVNFTMTPVANTSGVVQATMYASNGFTSASSSFTVVFRTYPPQISNISNKTMPEDATTNIAFTLSDPDTALASIVLSASSDNTNLINNTGLSFGGSGSNRTLTLTPRTNINGSANITVQASDGGNSYTDSFTLTVSPVPDQPGVSGMTNVQATSPGSPFKVLPTIVVSDVDDNMPNAATQVVTVTLSSASLAKFSDGTTTYKTTGTPAVVTATLTNLQAIPQSAGGVPGSANNLTISVSVNDGTFTNSTNALAVITVLNSPPALQVSLSQTNIVEGQSIQPFLLNFLTDPDLGDSTFVLQIGITNAYQASLGTITPSTQLVGNATTIGSSLSQIFFNSTPGIMTSSVATVGFTFTAFDGYGSSTVFEVGMQINQVQSPPSISGIPVETRIINDTPAGTVMYPTAFVSDPDVNGSQLVRASLSASPALGTFTTNNTPLLTQAGLIALLRAVKFIPTPGLVPVGAESNTVITLTVTDETGLSVPNNNLTIRISGINNAPQFPNFPDASEQPVLIPPAAKLYPFTDIQLTSDDTNAVSFTLSIDAAGKGTLSNLGSFVKSSATTYLMSGSVTSILSSLTNISYQLNPAYSFPPSDPGGTVFTLSARDYALLTKTVTLYIQVQAVPRHHLVTRTVNDGLPGSFTYALSKAGNNDFITFALPSYPAVIRMPGTATTNLVRNITIKGPGANLLTISGDNNGNNTPDRQIFQVSAAVTIEGVTLARGTANYGGAIQVLSNGVLTLRNAAVVDSVAAYYGGGIDVSDGALVLDGVFIGRNQVSASTGSGGGGISAYTSEDLDIRNSTFSGNQQANASGDGGGAMIVENSLPGAPMYVNITHTTFAENTDAAGRASAVLCVNEDAVVQPAYTIFSDKSGRNLDVAGNGAFDSQGANFSDDSTQTSFIQGGGPGVVVLLDHVTDSVSTDALLSQLASSGDPTPYYELLAGSPAINYAIGSSSAADQRGVIRTDVPDSGSFEYNAFGRLVINEIYAGTGAVHYVELFVRRDSTPIDLANFSLFVGDTAVHSFRTNLIIGTNDLFTAGATNSSIVRPGFGMVIAFTTNPVSLTANGNPNPVVMPSLLPTNRLSDQGVISVGLSAGSPIAGQSYLTRYLDPATGTNLLDVSNEAIALAPQFRGHALIPHSFVKSGPFDGGDTTQVLGTDPSSPGADADDVPFGLVNAFPVALSDIFTVTEDDLNSLDVLDNDVDSDGNDRVVVVDVSTLTGSGSGNAATAASVKNALVSIDPTNQPLRGTAILFDPRAASALQQLPVGTETIDSFFYEGIDVGRAAIVSQAAGSNATVVFESSNHRLTNGEQIVISGSSQSNYNGTFSVTVLGEDSFAVSNSFFSGVSQLGVWQTVQPRSPTARTEGSVTVRVLGVNDDPVAGADTVTGITERTVARVMIRPELAGSAITFPTDPSPTPSMLATNLIRNDDDVDTDDDWSNLRIMGVMSNVNAVSGYSGVAGALPVTVSAPAHGLTSGDTILLANYGGHPSYNGYSVVTVVDADTFTIPRVFVDNHTNKGVWVRAVDSTATAITSSMGAGVSLLLRTDVTEDHLIYDASVSDYLQGLSQNERCTNRVYYTVRDSHGASGIGIVDFVVTGVNNAPVAQPDPGSVTNLNPLVSSSNSIPAILGSGLDYMYTLPPSSGASNRLDVHALDLSGTVSGTIVLDDLFFTDEDTAMSIAAAELLVNDSDIDRTNTLSVISVDATSRVGVALSLGSGLIQYNPAPVTNLQALMRGEIVVDSFRVVVSDGAAGGNVTSLVAVAVLGVNDAPVASNVTLTTHEDENLRFDPRTNCVERDIDGVVPDDHLSLVPAANVSNPGLAPVTISATGVLHEATLSDLLNGLNAGDVFTNTFNYTVRDDSFLLAMDDEFDVLYDSGPYTLAVLANDRDYTGSTGAFTVVSVGPAAAEGTATISSNGTSILYTPPFSTYTGEDYFRYVIRNADGVESRARVTVRLVNPPVNGILFAADDEFAVARGETITMPVLANDGNTVGAGGLVITRIVSTSLLGQPVLTNNQLVYDASVGPNQLTFTYEVSAGGDSTAQADVRLDVVDRSGTLRTQDDTFNVLAGSLSNQLSVLMNDGLVGESSSSYRIRSILVSASHGSLTTNSLGTALVYTPNDGFIGTEQVRYLVADGLGSTGSGTVSIVVGQIEAARDFYTVAASTNPPSVALDVLENDRMLALPRGSLQIASVAPSSSSIGTIAVDPSGSNLVFSASGSSGESTFSYVLQDLSSPARSATGIVTVAAVPSGAYANPDSYIVRGNGSDYELDVLANDISYPTDGKVYSIVDIASAPDQGGSVEIQGDRIVYTPAEGFFGEESFTYTMSDSQSSDDAIVTLSVRRGDMSAARDRFAVYYEYEAGTNIARSFDLQVLDNDVILPPLDQTLTVASIGAGTNAPDHGGSAVVSGGQSITYRPLNPPTNEYIETFTYEVDDGAGRQASAVVEVRVMNRASNLVAVTHADAYAVARNSASNTFTVLANDGIWPATAASWTITSVSASSAGASISIQSGALRYTPPAGFVGIDTFTYSVSDGLGGTGSATVEVRVGALPTVDDYFVVLSDSVSNRLDVVANDAQSTNYVSEYVLFSASGADKGGSLALVSNKVVYTPATSTTGIERFSYVIQDDGGTTWSGAVRVLILNKNSDRSTATITLLVQGRNEAYTNAYPQAVSDVLTLTEDDTATLLPLANDTDADANDRRVIIDISSASLPGSGATTATNSLMGALLALSPVGTPLKAETVSYDPRATLTLQQLPVGSEILDSFYYEIIDYGSSTVELYSAGSGSTTLVHATNHRLTNGAQVTITGASNTAYNGTFTVGVSVVSDDVFTIPVAFAGNDAPRGRWEDETPRSPTARSEGRFDVHVVGVNDPPVGTLDVITNITERETRRLMVRPELAGQNFTFPSDPAPAPLTLLNQDVLDNDTDIDTDDDWSDLRVIGVMGGVHAIDNYSGTPGTNPVTVTSTAHGLTSGAEILIANYGGHVSYNGYHVVTVIDTNTFTIPRAYRDNNAAKGVWVLRSVANALSAVTDVGAPVTLTLRSNPQEDHFIYNASASSFLQGLAEGEKYTNRFYYAVRDRNDGIGIGAIDMIVDGTNNPPDASPDPDSLGQLDALVSSTNPLAQVLATGIDPMYALPPTSGSNGLVNLQVLDRSGAITGTVVISDIWTTDEDTAIGINTHDLLANDFDTDLADILQVTSVTPLSREGASLQLLGTQITYNPSSASNLQALARGELLVDSFEVLVSDGHAAGTVTTLVAVLVVGMNDSPVAFDDAQTTYEDEVLVFDARTNDVEIDINAVDPDDLLRIVPATNVANPAQADVYFTQTNIVHNPLISSLLTQLGGSESFTNQFQYTVLDNSFLFAMDDEIQVLAGSAASYELNVLGNDRDYTLPGSTFGIVDAGPTFAGGTVVISTNGQSVTYTPPPGFVGDDHFRYIIRNAAGGEAHARVTVRSVVPEQNGILRAADDAFTVAAGETVVLNVLANDGNTPSGGAGLTLAGVVGPTPSGLVLTNNSFTYDASYGAGPVTFEYTVSAGGSASGKAVVTINIVERRGGLVVQDDAFSVPAGSVSNVIDILANDGVIGESTANLRVRQILDVATHGTIQTNSTGTALIYTPAADFVGSEQIRCLVADGLGGTGTGTVRIVVARIEPVIDFYAVAASTNPAAVALDVLANDRMVGDARGTLTLVSVSPAGATSIGTLSIGVGGTNLLFSPLNVTGQVDFAYVLNDASVPPRVSTGRVTVATVPAGIFADTDRFIVRRGGTNYLLDVLANDISYPSGGQTYSIIEVGTPDQGGSVSNLGNRLSYTPAPNFFGDESFTYRMSDGVTNAFTLVTVSVRRGDLVANTDAYAVYYELQPGTNVAQQFALPVVLNDRIQPALGQTLSIVALGVGAGAPDNGGSISISLDGQSLLYRPGVQPSPSFVEHFTYEISDGAERRDSAVVSVLVKNRTNNLVAVTHPDAFAVTRNSASNVLAVLLNDGVLPGTASGWTITSVSGTSAGGTATIQGSSIRYTPATDYVGEESFTYAVSDGLGGTGVAQVKVRVGAIPTVDDLFVVVSGSVSNELDVLVNDVLNTNEASEYVLADAFGATSNGTVSVAAGQVVLYTPDATHTAPYPYTERFVYTIEDDAGAAVTTEVRVLVVQKDSDRDTATISVRVLGVSESNAVPVAQLDEFAVTEDWPSQLDVLLNDRDDDTGDVLRVADLSTGAGEGGDDAQTYSLFGALVSVDPLVTNLAATPPVQGLGVTYDPLSATNVQALPLGALLTDIFHYEVVDVGSGVITGYAAGASVRVYSPRHRLTNGTVVVVSGSSVTNYNGEATVTSADRNSFRLAGVAFAGDAAPRGTWTMRDGRVPSARSEAQVRLTVIGENDPPVPVTDVIPNVTEDTVTRILAMPDLIGSTTTVFDTDDDYPMVPVISTVSLLPNDTDPDSDDEGVSLHVIGVVSEPRAVVGYAGTVGASPVTVTATGHGLVSGDTVLISGYGGYVGYNGLHEVTVVDADTFTIPVLYFDDHAVKGVWTRLEDDNRLSAMSQRGATVELEIRADPRETTIVYNPRVSANLNGVAAGETVLDSFYYVAQDRHGAASLGFISIPVAGVNDMPVDVYDPEGGLDPLVPLAGSTPLADFLQTVPIDYTLPSALGTTGRMDVSVVVTGALPSYNLLLPDFWVTDEHTELAIAQSEVLGNASDVDTNDVLAVASVSPLSKLGASVWIDGGSGNLIYSPSNSVRLNALARGELIFDSFEVAVSDFAVTNAGTVTSLCAVVVRGVNDTPITSNDWYYITENGIVSNAAVLTNDIEFDIDGACPDDSLFILDETNRSAIVTHVSSNVPVPFTFRDSTFTFDPGTLLDGLVEGWIATAKVDYTAFDGSMLFAVDDQFVVQKGATGVLLNVTANDRDYTPHSEGFWIAALGNTSHSGTVVNLGGTNLLYSPATNYVGEEFFTYTLTNRFGVCTRGLVQVRVVDDKLNGILYPMMDHFAVAYGETVTVSLVANDYFLPENGLDLEVASILSAPDQGGSVAIGAGGTITYAPADIGPGSYPYTERFSYMVGDGGIARGTSFVEVLVVNRRGSLDVSDDAYSVEPGSASNELAVLSNDGFLPFGCPTWRLMSVTASPHAAISGDGRSIIYSPLPGFVGLETLEYVVTDDLGGTGTGVVQVTVGDVVVLPDVYTVLTNTVTTLDVLGNDRVLGQTQPSNGVITGIAPAITAQGAMSIVGGSALQFNASGATGTAAFAYTLTTSGGTVKTGAVTVTVIDLNAVVVANPDRFRALRDSTTNVLDVLANDARFPLSSGALVIRSIGTGVNAPDKGGTVVIGAGGTALLYTPAVGFSGSESFTYTVSNSVGESTASVVVDVDGGQIRANADAFTVLYEDDGMGAASAQYVLPVAVNDRMLPYYGQSLTIIAVGLDAASTNAPDRMGGVAISQDGQSLIYTPTNIGLVAEYVERFTYEITDGTFRRAYADVEVTVKTRANAVDLDTVDDTFAVRSNTESNELPVLANDGIRPATVAGWSITAITANPAHGIAALQGGQVFYTPDEDFVGWDSLDYAVTDGKGGSGEATVHIWVGELPGTPDLFAVVSGSQSNLLDVLANDAILGRNVVALDLFDAGWTSAGGSASVQGGQVVYTPDAGYAGTYPYTETLQYRLQDQTGGNVTGYVSVVVYERNSDSDTGTITVVVTGLNDPPTMTGIQTNLSMNDTQTVNPFGTVVIEDVDEWRLQPLTVLVRLNNPAQGAFSNLSGFLPIAYGLYRYVGPGDNVSTAIQSLVYHHAPYRLAVDAQEDVRFTVSVDDNYIAQPLVNSDTVIRVTGTMSNTFAPNHLLQSNGGRLLQWSSANPNFPTLLNLNDGWTNPTNVSQAWVSEEFPVLPQQLIFGFTNDTTVPLQALVIYNYGEGVLNRYSKGYEIWSSFDGTSYVKIVTGELLPNTTAQRIYLGSILSRRLRVVITGGYNPRYVELAEIEAYGLPMDLFWFDEDGDGQYSAYETTHGLDWTDPNDGTADRDGDGYSNADESKAGTDPTNPNDLLDVFFARDTLGRLKPAFRTVQDHHYNVQTPTSFGHSAGWIDLPGFSDVVGDGQIVIIDDVEGVPTRIYRVRSITSP